MQSVYEVLGSIFNTMKERKEGELSEFPIFLIFVIPMSSHDAYLVT